MIVSAGELCRGGGSAVVLKCIEELEHRDTAIEHGGEEAIGYPVMRKAIRTGSKLAIWLSERF